MRPRRWQVDQLEAAAATAVSYREVLRALGLKPAGGNYSSIRQEIHLRGISTEHFRGKGWSKGLSISRKPTVPLIAILVQNSTYQSYKLKKRLFAAGLKSPQCELCGWSKRTADGRVPLELDHVNGQPTDNRIENLRILCPNCHSLQPTHRGL